MANKKYSPENVSNAALNFITTPDEMKATEEATAEPAKRKPGRPRKTTTAAEQKPQKATEAKKQTKPKKSTAKRSEAVTEANTKPQKMLYTISLNKEAVLKMKKYAAMTTETIGDIVTAAIDAYIDQNPPTAEQRKAYEAKRKAEDIDL